MSYQEKRILTSILTGVAVMAAYCIYAFNKYSSGLVQAGDLKFWAVTMLIFIGIGIVASIIIQILFHILYSISIAVKKTIANENCDDKEIEKSIGTEIVEDEMDILIDLKSGKIGYFVAGFGFIAALVSLVLEFSLPVMINILFLSFSIASIAEGVGQLIYYRKGV